MSGVLQEIFSDDDDNQINLGYEPNKSSIKSDDEEIAVRDTIDGDANNIYPSVGIPLHEQKKESYLPSRKISSNFNESLSSDDDLSPNKIPQKLQSNRFSSDQSDGEDVKTIANKHQAAQNNRKKSISSDNSNSENQWQDTNQFQVKSGIKMEKSSKEYMFDENEKEDYEDENMMVDIGKSFFTSKPIIVKQKLEQRPNVVSPSEIIKQTLPKFIQNDTGMNEMQSVYMTNGIEFKEMGERMFWKFQQKEQQIEKQMFDILFEEFLNKNLMLPLFSDVQEHMEFNIKIRYLNKYTQLLNNNFYKDFHEALHKIIKNKKSGVQASQSFVNNESSKGIGLKGLYDRYIGNILTSAQNYSKVEIVKNHLVKKITCLKNLKSLPNFNTSKQKKDENENDRNNRQYRDTLFSLQDQIADLEILISFENSEKYCKAKSEKLQKKIWKQRLQKIIELKKKWVDQRSHPNKYVSKQIVFTI